MKPALFLACAATCLLAFGFSGVALFAASSAHELSSGQLLVYFGTYTTKNSQGIYVSRLDLAAGTLSPPELAGAIASPSFLALHPNHRFLYAVNEVADFQGKKSGAVSSFLIDPTTGKLTLLNQQPSGGEGPCHLNVDRTGGDLLVANYTGGSCAVLPIGKDGQLGVATAFMQHQGSSVNKQRQSAPHAHGIYVDARNRFAFVPDLGLDQILSYKFDARQGSLVPNDPPFASVAPGSGPRHLAFHPGGKYAYVINEMLCTVTAFAYDPDRGSLNELQTLSTLPAGTSANAGFSTAEIQAHPSGRFLYGSNRGHDTIAVFAIDQRTGKLDPVQHQSTQGKTPRGFGIDPSGRFLIAANQDSDSVVLFRIDRESGRLTPTGEKIMVGMPVSVTFLAPERQTR